MEVRGWAALLLACAAVPAWAGDRPSSPTADTLSTPALRALKDKAEALQTASPDSNSPAEIAAWQALYDAASAARVGRDRLVHPWAGDALVALAEVADAAGDTPTATARAQAALTILRPWRDRLPRSYVQAASFAGYGLAQLGRPSEAIGPLGEVADWYDATWRTLPPAERDTAAAMGKSNIEFAYGQALNLLGQPDKALLYQRRSWRTRIDALGPDHPDTIAAWYWVALFLYKAGHPVEAETEARAAVEAAIAHVPPSNGTYARSLESLGLILARTGRRSESVGYFQRSIEVKRRQGGAGNANFLAGLNNLADSLVQLERYDDAGPLALEAAAGFRTIEGERSVHAAGATMLAGFAAAADGRSAEAATLLGGSVAVARGLDPRERSIGPRALPVLIVADLDSGRVADARNVAAAYLTEARAAATSAFAVGHAVLLDAAARDDPAAPAAARALLTVVRDDRLLAESGELPQDQRAALDLVLRVAVRAGDAALGLEATAMLAGSRVAQAGRLVATRLATADPALAARVRGQQDAARALRTADDALLRALAGGGDPAPARAVRDAAAAALSRTEAALTHDYPRWVAVTGGAAPDLTAIQRGLRGDEAVVAIVPAFGGLYTLTVTHAAAAVRRAPLARKAVLDLVTRLRASLPTGRFDTAAAYALYRQFFPAADAALLRGVTSVRIVPVGAVAQVPFAALLTRPAPAAGAGAPWLIRRFALAVAPAVEPAAATAASVRPARLLAVGAPTPFGTGAGVTAVAVARRYFRGAGADTAALADLPPLPGAAREIAAAARAFGGSTILRGDEASEARLRTMDLRPYTALLFATHGLVSGEMEGVAEPALVLARPRTGEADDGLLTASEVATLRLDADWVILSACNTAAGGDAGAPAWSGLAQAFRYAGARALLLSHWPVRDDAATFVTVATVAGARAGLSRPVALQRAMVRLMAARQVEEAANPYIWAPYILLE